MLMDYPLQEFLQGLKEAVEEEFETQAKRIVWEVKAGDEEMEMDYTLLTERADGVDPERDFFREGDQAIHFTAWNESGNVVFEVRQGRSQPVDGAERVGTRAARSRAGAEAMDWDYFTSGEFWIRLAARWNLPTMRERRIASAADPAIKERGPGQRLQRMNKIVVIDDERPVLLTLEALLKRHGYSVQMAGTRRARGWR